MVTSIFLIFFQKCAVIPELWRYELWDMLFYLLYTTGNMGIIGKLPRRLVQNCINKIRILTHFLPNWKIVYFSNKTVISNIWRYTILFLKTYNLSFHMASHSLLLLGKYIRFKHFFKNFQHSFRFMVLQNFIFTIKI